MAISSVVFDVECFNLTADVGIILCAVLKEQDKPPLVFRGDKFIKNWAKERSEDGPLVLAISQELVKHPIWIGYNAKKFDIPYINSRLIRSGHPVLPSPKVLIDPVELARNKLRMSFNGLKQVATLLGCNTKTELDPTVWCKCAYDGCSKSLDIIVEHCIQDVLVLEKVVDRVKDLSTGFNSWGSGR